MALNFYCTDANPTSLSLIINDKGILAKGRSGCGEPYVIVKHDNFEKQIVLPCGTSTDGFKTIDLTLRKGLFGFDIIERKTLSK